MFRNQYDRYVSRLQTRLRAHQTTGYEETPVFSDVTVWSPQGRLHQVDYAVEAMKQGSATVGVKSNTHAVVVALKRAANELCSFQKKVNGSVVCVVHNP